MMQGKQYKIIISRTDSIGDVVLTLPMAGILKSAFPECIIYFIAKNYTRAVIESCSYIDYFLDKEELLQSPDKLTNIQADVIIHVFPDKEIAKLAAKNKIPMRIGTSHRFFHWLFCNKLVNFSRKNSDEHESQLNLKLLKPLRIEKKYELNEIAGLFGMEKIAKLPYEILNLISKEKFNLILHPKSKGSAREWPLEKYYSLACMLPKEKFLLFITGTEEEGQKIKSEKPELFLLENVIDMTGKLTLANLISFIFEADGLVACSTGPLHIGAAMGKSVCGIYPPMKPIHPDRWGPIGDKASVLSLQKDCSECRKTKKCSCIESIEVQLVREKVMAWSLNKR